SAVTGGAGFAQKARGAGARTLGRARCHRGSNAGFLLGHHLASRLPTTRVKYNLSEGLVHPRSATIQTTPRGVSLYQEPVLAMLFQGSAGGSASAACSSSMEMPSGERTKAMRPSRGGRLIVTPRAIKALQVA